MTKLKLDTKPSLSKFGRAQLAADIAPVVETMPNEEPGSIKGCSIITKGEALGHYSWIDDEMLAQVSAAITDSAKGIKSRFTHPGMCSDGLGKHLGRIVNASISGASVIGDLQFAKSAYTTPEGNLAQYVIDLVNEDPEAAGLSIACERDYDAELKFALDNGARVEEDGDGYRYLDMSGFKSPDPANTNNYPHVRLAELRACDVVDEPAANPNGMFDSNPIARDADGALAYMLGLSKDKPADVLFGVNVDRASEFVTKFLANRKLELSAIKEPEPAKPVSRDDYTAELEKFTAKFGSENGVKWFTGKKTYEQALELHIEALGKQNTEWAAQVKDLTERLSAVHIGTDPLPIAGLSEEKPLPKTISEAKANAAKAK